MEDSCRRRSACTVCAALAVMAGVGVLAPVPAVADSPPAPVLAAAGDISCDPSTVRDDGGVPQCHELDTSNLFAAAPPTGIVTLGDNQYEFARLENFQAKFEPSWGRFKPLIRSGVGNHEYAATQTADGYFDYFNGVGNQSGPAGPRTTTSATNGRYSWDLGGWHLVSLNSSCKDRSSTVTIPCRNYNYGHVTTESVSWLRSDLAAHPGVCTLAYWHHPMFSSGPGDPTLETEVRPYWDELSAAGADVVLNGHAHDYERFAQQTPASVASTIGIREFIVGTGGRSFSQFFLNPPVANSEVRLNTVFGVLFLTLYPRHYDWAFRGENGTVYDSGTTPCHSDAPPRTSFTSAPDAARVGDQVTFDGSASSDPDDGSDVSFGWDLNADGVFDEGAGPTASRTFTEAGTYAVSLRVTDRDGASTTATRSVSVAAAPVVVAPTGSPPPEPPVGTPDTRRPVVGRLGVSPRAFRAAASGPSARFAAVVGTRVSVRVSEAALSTFRVERAVTGRRVRGRCVAVTRANARARPCTRYVLVAGGFSRGTVAGLNSFHFTGRVWGRRLRLGAYRLVVSAADRAGNRSVTRRTGFRIVG